MKNARLAYVQHFMPLGMAICILSQLFLVEAAGSDLRRSAIVQAVEAAAPGVVNIHGQKTVSDRAENGGQTRRVNGMGTGVVVDERGYIITNFHVVENVVRIEVTFADGTNEVGQLIAYDSASDLAIIKVPTQAPLPLVKIGTSNDLMAGETVIAMGNAYGYEHTVTTGIISALNRSVQVSDEQHYDDLIQTDASINPGNSGGPLMNIDGDVIGINVAVRVGAQGIGFAIPIDRALDIAAQLMTIERVDGNFHGVRGRTEIEEGHNQLVVQSLIAGGPGDLCGLKVGDVISHVGGKPITRALDLELALLASEAGENYDVVVHREGEAIDLSLTIAATERSRRHNDVSSWSSLGLQLTTVDPTRFRQSQPQETNYRGGLMVQAVREGSPAMQQGIRAGDILVGMHTWATASLSDVDFILHQRELIENSEIKFYVIRNRKTFFGYLSVAMNQ